MVSSTRHVLALSFFIGLLFFAVMDRDLLREAGTLIVLGAGLAGLACVVGRNLTGGSARE